MSRRTKHLPSLRRTPTSSRSRRMIRIVHCESRAHQKDPKQQADCELLRRNWSSRKRNFVGVLIGLLTFAIYVGSAIYTPSIPGLMEEFGASQVLATAGLTLFVTFYGLGPMLLAPMQEVASIGRNPVYIAGLLLFVIFQIPPLFANGMAVILVFRAAAGFVGSPALATGGASMGDIFPGEHYAIALVSFASSPDLPWLVSLMTIICTIVISRAVGRALRYSDPSADL